MAAMEARAGWQRAAGRYFIQEDAKVAPKITCSQSSTSKPPSNTHVGEAASETDHPAAISRNIDPGNPKLQPVMSWWLQLQPNCACQKSFTCEGPNASQVKIKQMRDSNINPTSTKFQRVPFSCVDDHLVLNKNGGSCLESNWKVPATCMKHDSDAKLQELRTVSRQTLQPLEPKVDVVEYGCWDGEFMDLKNVSGSFPDGHRKASFRPETCQVGDDRIEQWWWTADKDDLHTLVALKSMKQIENCDLPWPKTMNFRKTPFCCLESCDHRPIPSASLDQKIHSGLCKSTDCVQAGRASAGSMDGRHPVHSYEVGSAFCDSNRLYSNAIKDQAEAVPTSKTSPSSKEAQLMEALCHSQTRARKAEKAAQQAYTEKEHIVTLFFRQAYHLFACKQWLLVLQLETLLLQLKLKAKDRRLKLSPVIPWVPSKVIRRKLVDDQKKCRKYAVAFVVGLNLVGAGLLLGWNLGWLLPAF